MCYCATKRTCKALKITKGSGECSHGENLLLVCMLLNMGLNWGTGGTGWRRKPLYLDKCFVAADFLDTYERLAYSLLRGGGGLRSIMWN